MHKSLRDTYKIKLVLLSSKCLRIWKHRNITYYLPLQCPGEPLIHTLLFIPSTETLSIYQQEVHSEYYFIEQTLINMLPRSFQTLAKYQLAQRNEYNLNPNKISQEHLATKIYLLLTAIETFQEALKPTKRSIKR